METAIDRMIAGKVVSQHELAQEVTSLRKKVKELEEEAIYYECFDHWIKTNHPEIYKMYTSKTKDMKVKK